MWSWKGLAVAAAMFVMHLPASSSVRAAEPVLPVEPAPQWIWLEPVSEKGEVNFRHVFTVASKPAKAQIIVSCDNTATVFLNGERLLVNKAWDDPTVGEITSKLQVGENVLAVQAKNEGGPAGLLVEVVVIDAAGKASNVVSDATWKASATPAKGWRDAKFDADKWGSAVVLGPVGKPELPWSNAIKRETLHHALVVQTSAEFKPVLAEGVRAPAGFRVEKVFDVPKSMGSWVALATDDKGRLVASDQGNAGLFLITPAPLGSEGAVTKVQKLPVAFSGAQGLTWAFGSMYGMINGGDKSGLHRLTDRDGDGLLESQEYLMAVPGGGEHGPHAVIPAPDGQSLYCIGGNHTKLPAAIATSRLPQNWNEDHLLPRQWDARGHAAGILAPGGWICQVDPDGKQWHVVSMGYRNQYDMAFNADGELFAYDADMEWDLGMPWYRPTRVVHATSGSEFGWRSGTGKWPTYYADSLPPAVDIGPGSPVGVTFGYGTKFPAKYQKALFILDWTFSTIYAIHLTPEGSTYRGEKEDFVSGQPLQVTDAAVGADGALYFTIGGRGTQSALFRIVYTGDEPTAAADAKDAAGADLRRVRRTLEGFHGRVDATALDQAWPYLSHPDRFMRYAARIAVENQPVETWRERAVAESQPTAAIHAGLALARQGKPEDQAALVAALTRLPFAKLDQEMQLAHLRALQLAFIRLGAPSDAVKAQTLGYLEPLYPTAAASDPVNLELCQLLVFLESPKVVGKTIALMAKLKEEAVAVPDWGEIAKRHSGYGGTVQKMLENMPPVPRLALAFALRNAKTGWSLADRQAYFSFFLEAAKYPGGASYPGFLVNMREDAIKNATPRELLAIDDLIRASLVEEVKSTPPKGPGKKWTQEEALAVLGDKDKLRGRNYASGRNLYHATACAKCHRFNGEGGAVGPDLSTAGLKFSLKDLMDAIIEPSKAISDQYGSEQILTDEGEVLVGRAVEIGEQLHVYLTDPNQPPKVIPLSAVEAREPSKISQMPVGTMDALNPEEVKDLVAYILSGGNQRATYFQK